MRKSNVPLYTVEEISRQLDPYAIKNFIISDAEKKTPDYLFDYPHTLDGIVFSICIKGSARFKINMQEYSIRPNTTVTILPNTIVEPLERSQDFFLETLFFSFDFIAELPLPPDINIFELIEQSPCLYVTEQEVQNLLKFHSFIVEQYNRKEHCFRQEIAKCLLFALIAEVGALYSDKERTDTRTRMEKQTGQFLALLRKHYKKERHLSFYAKEMCLTPKYLTSTIKKITGKSILVWIHEAVIASAKVQLKSTSKTVVQISEDLNFTDSSLFCRFFKKHTGMTPVQYRRLGVSVFIP